MPPHSNAWNPNFYQLSPWYLDIYPSHDVPFAKATWPDLTQYNQYYQHRANRLVNQQGRPIEFIPQTEKATSFNKQYEPLIYQKGHVLTRTENWHDFFNFLVWTTWPKSKALINAYQFEDLAHRQKKNVSQRTRRENTLTLFDENGLIIVSKHRELLTRIQQHDWQALFWKSRDLLVDLNVIVFGHALYEKLLAPYIGLTGHAWLIHDDLNMAGLDAQCCERLKSTDWETFRLQPFPLLGMPGAHPGNNQAQFYNNRDYFRPKRA